MSYGTTNSEKDLLRCKTDVASYQILPASLVYLFQNIRSQVRIPTLFHMQSHKETSVYISFIQIYCEKIGDLLVDRKENLAIRETKELGVFIKESIRYWNLMIQDLTRIKVNSVDETLEAIVQARERCVIAISPITRMSESTSRATLILFIEIETTENINGVLYVRKSKLAFVDLSGMQSDAVTNRK